MTPCKPRQVVCAALRKDGLVICSARHYSGHTREIIKRLGLSFGGWEQGFIDQNDVFLTREEAYLIAKERGQVSLEELEWLNGRVSLISENLY